MLVSMQVREKKFLLVGDVITVFQLIIEEEPLEQSTPMKVTKAHLGKLGKDPDGKLE